MIPVNHKVQSIKYQGKMIDSITGSAPPPEPLLKC